MLYTYMDKCTHGSTCTGSWSRALRPPLYVVCYIHTYTHIHTHTHTHIHTYLYTCIHTYIHTYIPICVVLESFSGCERRSLKCCRRA